MDLVYMCIHGKVRVLNIDLDWFLLYTIIEFGMPVNDVNIPKVSFVKISIGKVTLEFIIHKIL